ncbi:MAG: PAS domain S-box protein, partial [Nitrospirota bacterium]|nr:PAS domain S-box protein [Nitrospirota bacterium]
IREHQAAEVNNWLAERTGDVLIISKDNEVRMLERLDSGKEADAGKNIMLAETARDLLKRYLLHYDSFYELFIISPRSGRVLVSSNEKDEGMDYSRDPHFIRAAEKQEMYIEDIHYSAEDKRPCMNLFVPVYGLIQGSRPFGILVARVDLDRTLYKLLMGRAGMGETGEVLIVNKDQYALSELRWHKDAPLKMRIQAPPAVKASCGMTGVSETVDYRGEPVLAAYTHIPRTGWGFVVKQDIREVYAPVRGLRKWALVVGIMTVLGVTIIAFRISGSISGPIEKLQKGTEIIGGGDLDHKVGNDNADEIGRLSRTFDMMTENLKKVTASKDELDREVMVRRMTEVALSLEKDRMQRYLDVAGVMFLALDVKGGLVLINNKGCEVLGYDQDEIMGRNWFDNFIPERFRDEVRKVFGHIMAGRTGLVEYYENPVVTKDGRERIIAWHNTLLRDEKGCVTGALSSGEDITEQRHLERTVLEIEERERRRIGNDLHDGLGQLLTGISIKLKCLESDLRERMAPEAEDAEKISRFVDQAKKQAKYLAKGLAPVSIKDGETLMGAIRDIAADTEKIFNVPCVLKCDTPVIMQNETAVTHLYRIAQEAITNAVKHGAPDSIEISLDKEDERVVMTIRDDGRGIGKVPERGDGMGLKIMGYRAGMIGASLDVRCDGDRGTVVKCVFADKTGGEDIDNEIKENISDAVKEEMSCMNDHQKAIS